MKIVLIIFFIITAGCVSESEHQKAKDEIKRLTKELDDCKNGAERLTAEIDKAYEDKNYAVVRDRIGRLQGLHPNYKNMKKYKNLLVIANKKLEERVKEYKKTEIQKTRISQKTGAADICDEIRSAYLKTVASGASVTVLSKGASDLYNVVGVGGRGSHCKYLRYAFRKLKKPFNGEKVSPAEWSRSIENIKNRAEF